MDFVAESLYNPFGMDPPCEQYVPGYGRTDAHFHVIGDNPATHGGRDSAIPFTGRPWSRAFFDALAAAGLCERLDTEGDHPAVGSLFLSYLYMCDPGDESLTEADYARLEPFFDAELRAITAHVLLPIGARATAHVFDQYTARPTEALDMDALHGTEIRGSGWLVVPIKDPSEWTDGDANRLVDALVTLQQSDYRRTSDLGRFLADDDSYLVR